MAGRNPGILRLLLLAALWFSACHANAAADTGDPGGDFTLTDQYGRNFRLQQLQGKVVLLFFGYTYCPDICPTELSNLVAVLDALENRASDVRGVFVSLDPERDTVDVLRSYTRYFSDELIGLTGSQEQIAAVARQYRVKYSRHQTADGRYSLDHTANLYVIDQTGRLAALVPYGLPPEHVLELVRDLLDNGG